MFPLKPWVQYGLHFLLHLWRMRPQNQVPLLVRIHTATTLPGVLLCPLRQPIEEGKITISRAKNTATFPSRFMLVGASNPCPCGYFSSPERTCTCSPSQVAMYRRK